MRYSHSQASQRNANSSKYSVTRKLPSTDPLPPPSSDQTDYQSSTSPLPITPRLTTKTTDISQYDQLDIAHLLTDNPKTRELESQYHRLNANKDTLSSELNSFKLHNDRLKTEKDNIKKNYEDFINRLNQENRELKKTEYQFEQLIKTKKFLEFELERISTENTKLKGNSDQEEVVEELKNLIQRLKEEKSHLRRQLEYHRYQISEMNTNVTTITHTKEDAIRKLKQDFANLESNYNLLMVKYNEERKRPIQIPDDPRLREILEQKIATIASLNTTIRFLGEQLEHARNRPCNVCPSKAAKISMLTNEVKQLRSVSIEKKTVQILPVQQEVIRLPTEYHTTYTCLPPKTCPCALGSGFCSYCNTVLPPASGSVSYIGPPAPLTMASLPGADPLSGVRAATYAPCRYSYTQTQTSQMPSSVISAAQLQFDPARIITSRGESPRSTIGNVPATQIMYPSSSVTPYRSVRRSNAGVQVTKIIRNSITGSQVEHQPLASDSSRRMFTSFSNGANAKTERIQKENRFNSTAIPSPTIHTSLKPVSVQPATAYLHI